MLFVKRKTPITGPFTDANNVRRVETERMSAARLETYFISRSLTALSARHARDGETVHGRDRNHLPSM